jgi:glutathione S-transferase
VSRPAHPDLAALVGMRVHGLDLSYFTGKLQAYLRYCELPFEFVDMDTAGMRRAARATGMAQMPAIELADGRWMTDTTAIIGWIEARRTGPEVTPGDPALRFFSLLLEDYADEWLWRPALHYRWSFQPDTALMGRRIAAEMMRDVPAPLALRTAMIIARQQRKYVGGDGVTAANRGAVEDLYRRTLAALEAILATRPFLLGDRPSLADFGFMGSMFRHFSLDPTPARMMRDTAPAVFEWVARMWNAKASALADGAFPDVIPEDWEPFLVEAATGYLPYLAANAEAAASGQATLAVTIQGVAWRLPVNLNRVHCLKALQAAFAALPADAATAVRSRLEAAGAWTPLWRVTAPDIGFDPQGRLPFLTPETAWAPDTAPGRSRPVHNGAAR